MQTIKFQRITSYWGRNGHAKCAGIDLFESGLPSQSIGIIPINSKNQQGSAEIYLPKESIPDIIKALSEYAPKPEPQYFLFGETPCRNFFEMEFNDFIQDAEENGLDGITFEWDGANVADLLSAMDGWASYSFLTKAEYDKINEL